MMAQGLLKRESKPFFNRPKRTGCEKVRPSSSLKPREIILKKKMEYGRGR
jgi:hypothetical protein